MDLAIDKNQCSDAECRVAVIVPCYNEAVTIEAVVARARKALPAAEIYVYDNNSTDKTAALAREAGAIVRHESYQGKGNVVRRMFADVEASIYIMVDGDNTYDLDVAADLVQRMRQQSLDFINAARKDQSVQAYRPGHRIGNVVLSRIVREIFGHKFDDMLSGYKLFSRRFVKSFPIASGGFEIETELTIHALEMRMPCCEVVTSYGVRPSGSSSKLSTYKDGVRILRLIFRLVKDERPLQLFGILGLCAIFVSIAFGVPIIWHFLETGLVPRLPTAVLSTGLALIGVISISIGLVLDMVTRARREAKQLAYLRHLAPR